jgi:hypothetical protein
MFLLCFPAYLMLVSLKRLLTAPQNLHSEEMCPNAEFVECMTKRRTKLLSWSWAGSVMNQTASIRRYWDIDMKNEWSLDGSRFEFEAETIFAYLSYRFRMNCWSRPKLLLRQLLRRWMLTKKHDDLPKSVSVLLKSLIPLWWPTGYGVYILRWSSGT